MSSVERIVETTYGRRLGGAWGRLGFLAAGAVIGVVMGPRLPNALVHGEARPARAFVSTAVGTVSAAVDMTAAPGGAETVGTLPEGSAVEVAGSVHLPDGLGSRDYLWVSVSSADGPRLGYVPADDVRITAGQPQALDLATAAGAVTAAGLTPPSTPAITRDLTDAPTTAPTWLPASVTRWWDLCTAAGRRHGVDPALVAIVVLVESGGNPNAVSPSGAVGLMQVMPSTAADIARSRAMTGFAVAQLYQPAVNVDFGAWYLAQQLAAFGQSNDEGWNQSVALAAAAYNGGPGTARRHVTSGTPLPAETRSYQRWVGGLWRERADTTSPTLSAWLAAGGQALVDAAR